MGNTIVSVYCMAYNHKKYIKATLEGFVKQKTNFKYEVIVHDDASADGTDLIIKEYAEKYPQIIKPIFQSENQYSKGVRIFDKYIKDKIKGKYLAFCEGDDCWIDENKLQIQYDFLEKNKDYVACVHQSLVNNRNTKEIRLYSIYNTDCDLDLEKVLNVWGSSYHFSSLMLLAEMWINRPEFAYISTGDIGIATFLSISGKIRYINRIMSVYNYLSTEDSWSFKLLNCTDVEKRIRKSENKNIKMLKMADQYSEYRFHKTFQYIIALRICCLKKSMYDRNLFCDKYQKTIFKRENIKKKIAIFLDIYFSKMYKFLIRNRQR